MVDEWKWHWERIERKSSSHITVEGQLIDYQQAIRTAFTGSHVPEYMLTVMPAHIMVTQRIIMNLPVRQREALLVWTFGDDDERLELFGRKDAIPSKIKDVYRKIGRRATQVA